METGIGENLKGFLITGNLSVLKGQNPSYHGDGSLEGTGTLYFDNIQQFSDLNGLTIQDINIKDDIIYIPYTKPSTNISSASFIIDGGISITNTSNSLNISNGGALTIAGGVSISKNVNIGKELDMNINKIINVNDPENDYDAVNKRYLTGFVNSITHGNVIGDFGADELITGTTDPTKITSQPNLKYISTQNTLLLNNSFLNINSTENVSGSSGGALISYGGVNIQNNLFVKDQVDVNNNNIKNVKIPLDDYDAIPKKYLLDIFNLFFNSENTFYIDDNINSFTPTNITLDTDDVFVNLHIYISIDSNLYPKYAIINLLLYKDQTLNTWYISKTFVGDNTLLDFEIQNNILHYKNPNTSLSGSSFIITHTHFKLKNPDNLTLTNTFSFTYSTELISNTQDQPFYTINNNDLSFITYFYIYNNTTNEYGIIKLYSVKKNTSWYNNISKHSIFPFIHDININIDSVNLIYTNNNLTNYNLIMYSTQIDDIPSDITLFANTTTNKKINQISFNQFDKSFFITLYLEAGSNVSLYELYGLYNNNNWYLHVNLVGDPFTSTNVQFSIDQGGFLNYINTNNFDVFIKYILLESNVLPVKYGGTGTNYHLDDSVLLGNGYKPIKSSSSLMYKNNELSIKSTNENSINTLGGISVQNTINMNNNKIINLEDPIDDKDAVNKRFLDSYVSSNIFTDNLIKLENNVITPSPVNFIIAPDKNAFIIYIYIHKDHEICSMYILKGLLNNSQLYVNQTFIGANLDITFSLETDINNNYILYYTNPNPTNSYYIRINFINEIYNLPQDNQVNYSLLNNINIFTSIPVSQLVYPSNDYLALKFIIYIIDSSTMNHTMINLLTLNNDSSWIYSVNNIGSITNVNFKINKFVDDIYLQYKNLNSTGNFIAKINTLSIKTIDPFYILNSNTLSPTIITPLISFDKSQHSYIMIVYLEVLNEMRYSLVEIEGLLCNENWILNTKFIGDKLDVIFTIENDVLYYVNPNNNNIKMYYNINIPEIFDILPVKRGGTGNNYFSPNKILFGNGIDPIKTSSELMFHNNQLVLGDNSNILLQNTSNNTLTSFGGANFKTMYINSCEITPNPTDFISEKTFVASHNILIPVDITNFLFGNSTRCFTGVVSVCITTSVSEFVEIIDLKCYKKSNNWYLNTSSVGDTTNIILSITNIGQIQYTLPHYSNWISTTIKYRGITTTI